MQREIVGSQKIEIKDVFNPALTELFKSDLDLALRKINVQAVEDVLHSYQLTHFQDSIDFLDALDEFINQWRKEEWWTVIIAGSVTTSKSKCIACEIGRNITVYEFEYLHANAPKPISQIHYRFDFGVLLDIRKGALCGFRLCNAFLNKTDLNNLEAN